MIIEPLPGISIMELNHSTCRWPVHGEGLGMRYCGKQIMRGSCCKEHHSRMYGMGTDSERRAVKEAMRFSPYRGMK